VLYPHLSGLNLSERLHERLSVPATTALGGHATFCGEPEADVPGYRLAQLMWGRGIDLTVASGRALDFFNTFPGALPVGHMRVAVPGRPCACGRTGCMEAELAGPALTARLADRHEDLAGLSVERMEAEAARGEERIVAELEAAAERLAMHFGPLMQVSTPRELRLIGGLGLAAPRLIEAMHRGFERVLHADQARAMEISVHDDPMTLRLSGACRLGRMEFLTPGLVRRLRVPTRSFTDAAGGSPTWADAEAAMPIEV